MPSIIGIIDLVMLALTLILNVFVSVICDVMYITCNQSALSTGLPCLLHCSFFGFSAVLFLFNFFQSVVFSMMGVPCVNDVH